MKHVLKIMALLVAISAFWIGLPETSVILRSYTWLLPIYLIVSLGCYGLLTVGIGLMLFPTCPQEAVLLRNARVIPHITGAMSHYDANFSLLARILQRPRNS